MICGPCAGVDIVYACRQCGHSGDLFREQRCSRCVLSERLIDLLTGPEGTMTPELRRVHGALGQANKPRHLIHWLARSGVPRLLADLASSGKPITHQHLDNLPSTPTTRYTRDLLVAAGVLPPRDEHLERLPSWIDQLLAQAPARHRQIATPFAHWHLLRRLRRAHHRGNRRMLRVGSVKLLRSRLHRALELLNWLDQRNISLAELTQADLEQWLEEGASTRREVNSFLLWARGRGLTADLTVPLPTRSTPITFIEDDERIQQLRRCIGDEELPLGLRVTGSLILLFGLHGTRILHLTRDDIVDDGVNIDLDIEGHRLSLPPKLGQLLRRLRDQCESRWTLNELASPTPWLIPGQSPARPLRPEQLQARLREYGLSGLAGRNTARLALAAELPASILADLTGTSVTNAVLWTAVAKRDWTDYVASREQNPRR